VISKNRFVQAIYDATWGRFVFAGAYEWFLKTAEEAGLADHRQQLISQARGRTLEIATGTGLNLPHYSDAVTELVLTELYPPMAALLRAKVAAADHRAEVVEAAAENLPFPDGSFDTVVGTMILCTAEKPELVLQEISRVLRPGGQYLFLEHIRNPDPKIAKKQDRIQPAWYLFGNGCHCNRDSVETLRQSSLIIQELNYGQIPKAWTIIEAMVSGRAQRASDREQVTSGIVGSRAVEQPVCSSAQCATVS